MEYYKVVYQYFEGGIIKYGLIYCKDPRPLHFDDFRNLIQLSDVIIMSSEPITEEQFNLETTPDFA